MIHEAKPANRHNAGQQLALPRRDQTLRGLVFQAALGEGRPNRCASTRARTWSSSGSGGGSEVTCNAVKAAVLSALASSQVRPASLPMMITTSRSRARAPQRARPHWHGTHGGQQQQVKDLAAVIRRADGAAQVIRRADRAGHRHRQPSHRITSDLESTDRPWQAGLREKARPRSGYRKLPKPAVISSPL